MSNANYAEGSFAAIRLTNAALEIVFIKSKKRTVGLLKFVLSGAYYGTNAKQRKGNFVA